MSNIKAIISGGLFLWCSAANAVHTPVTIDTYTFTQDAFGSAVYQPWIIQHCDSVFCSQMGSSGPGALAQGGILQGRFDLDIPLSTFPTALHPFTDADWFGSPIISSDSAGGVLFDPSFFGGTPNSAQSTGAQFDLSKLHFETFDEFPGVFYSDDAERTALLGSLVTGGLLAPVVTSPTAGNSLLIDESDETAAIVSGVVEIVLFDTFEFLYPTFDPLAESTESTLDAMGIITNTAISYRFDYTKERADIFAHRLSTGEQFLVASTVPVPPAVWLFGSGLVGLLGMSRFRSKRPLNG